jgi:chorismate mutase-like protein
MNDAENKNRLGELRNQIDLIDNDLIEILATRIGLMPDFAQFKEMNNLSIEDNEREKEILERMKKIAKEKGLDPKFVEKIFLDIFEEAKKVQKEVLTKN